MNPSVLILSIQRNDPNCGVTEDVASQQRGLGTSVYSVAPGASIGSVAGAGVSVPLAATHGTVVTESVCSDGACFSRFDRLKIGIADFTVLGQSITAASIQSTKPASISAGYGHGQIAAGDLDLRLVGRLNGAPRAFGIRNTAALTADFGNQTMRLAGSFDLVVDDATGAAVPVATTLDVSAPKANA